jgi:hypothetical protein
MPDICAQEVRAQLAGDRTHAGIPLPPVWFGFDRQPLVGAYRSPAGDQLRQV